MENWLKDFWQDLPTQVLFGIAIALVLWFLNFMWNNYKKINDFLIRRRNRQIKDRHRKGWQMMTAESNKGLTRLLLDHYSGTNSADLVYLGYEYKNMEYREYPLVTAKDLLLLSSKSKKTNYKFFDGQPFQSMLVNNIDLNSAKKYLEIVGLNFWDSPIYSLYSIEQDLSSVEFTSCNYNNLRFQAYRYSFGSLSDELAQSVAKYGIEKLRKKWKRLDRYWPKRKKLLASADDVVSKIGTSYYCNRICAGGTLALFVMDTQENGITDTAFVIQRRSQKVSDEPGVFSVVPKSFHTPSVDIRKEVNPINSIYREIYEELFGGEDKPEKLGYVMPYYYRSQSSGVNALMEDNGNNHELVPLGILWDLVQGNFHMSYLFYIKDISWWNKYKDQLRVNWEVDEEVTPLIKLSETEKIIELIRDTNWAADSYFTFVEGLRWLCKTRKIKGRQKILELLPTLRITHLDKRRR